ncbi:MAG: GAF domain-containing protein [Candidatus Odinarchaeota archaeon]
MKKNHMEELDEARKTIVSLEKELEETNKGVVALTLELEQYIEELKLAERKIREQSTLLEAINKILKKTLSCETEEELIRLFLVIVEQMTSGEVISISEVNKNNRLDPLISSDSDWEPRGIPKSEILALSRHIESQEYMEKVIRTGELLVLENPASILGSKEVPDGYLPVSSFLWVPLKRGEKTIGIMVLASREEVHCLQVLQLLENLAVVFVEALYSKRSEIEARKSAISRQNAGQILRDLQAEAEITSASLIKAGYKMASRSGRTAIKDFLDFYSAMGLGTVTYVENESKKNRWIFNGDQLIEKRAKTDQPMCNYTLGYLCGAITCICSKSRVTGVEIECQSMGDKLCKFIIQEREGGSI